MSKILTFFIRQLAFKYLFNQLRQRAVLIYLKTLQVTRQSLLIAIALFIMLQLMVFGFIGTVITAVWLWPTSIENKLMSLLLIFAFLLVVPLFGLIFFFSERYWFKASGAAQMIKAKL
jgi:CBS domain containing-hemolysin-like protein